MVIEYKHLAVVSQTNRSPDSLLFENTLYHHIQTVRHRLRGVIGRELEYSSSPVSQLANALSISIDNQQSPIVGLSDRDIIALNQRYVTRYGQPPPCIDSIDKLTFAAEIAFANAAAQRGILKEMSIPNSKRAPRRMARLMRSLEMNEDTYGISQARNIINFHGLTPRGFNSLQA